MSVSYQKISNLPFYSLNEFTQLQPLSRGRSAIYLYQHHDSQEVFVVKETPFREDLVRIYETLMKLRGLDSVVTIRGVCKMVIKYERLPKKRNREISEQSLYVDNNSQCLKQRETNPNSRS